MSSLDSVKVDSSDEETGVSIVKSALSAPCKTIAKNAGVDSSRVIEKLLQSTSPSEGYDALHDKYVDMIQAGTVQYSTVHTQTYIIEICV